MILRVVMGCQCLYTTLVGTDSPSCFLGGWGAPWEERRGPEGDGLRWKRSPGLPKPLSDCALVIPSLGPWDSFCSGVSVSRLC